MSRPGTEPSSHEPKEIVLTGRLPFLSKWSLMNITHFNRCIHKKLPIMDVMHEFFSLGNRLLLLAISWSGFDESLSGAVPIEIGFPEWGLKEQLNKDLYNCSIMIKWFPWARQFRKTCFHLATFALPKWNSHIYCRHNLIHYRCCCYCGRLETWQDQARREGDPVQAHCTWQPQSTWSWGSQAAPLCACLGQCLYTALFFATSVLLLKCYLSTALSDVVWRQCFYRWIGLEGRWVHKLNFEVRYKSLSDQLFVFHKVSRKQMFYFLIFPHLSQVFCLFIYLFLYFLIYIL